MHKQLGILLLVISMFACFGVVEAQEHTQGAGASAAVDSLHVPERSMDSLLKEDSLVRVLRYEEERRFERTKQLASQREIDLSNDGKPEVLRLNGFVAKNIDDTKLTFTIKSGNKLLFEDSWLAKGYFDTLDHLSDSIKLKRLRSIVTVAFANENFVVLDSTDFVNIVKQGSAAEIQPGSPEANRLFKEPRVMYSIFHSRDYWYGLVWDPERKKFVKAWRN